MSGLQPAATLLDTSLLVFSLTFTKEWNCNITKKITGMT